MPKVLGARRAWRDPRHVAVSLAVAAVGLLVASPPVVEAALAVGEEPAFVFAHRRVGDQGTYRQWLHESGQEPQVTPEAGGWHVMAWQWATPEQGPRGLDRYGAVNILEVDVDSPWEALAGRLYFEPVAFEPLAFERFDAPTGAFPPFDEAVPNSMGPLA